MHVDYVNYHVVIFMSNLHLNELSLICDMWINKITYLITYLLSPDGIICYSTVPLLEDF